MNATARGYRQQLRAPEPGDRAFAAYMLGSSGSKSSVSALRRTLASDPSQRARDSAAGALGQIGDVGAIPLVLRRIDEVPPRDAWDMAWALASLADKATPIDRDRAIAGLVRYRARARGRSRAHADELIRSLSVKEPRRQ